MTSHEIFKSIRGTTLDDGPPLISTQLDSVRAYQFELHFTDIPGILLGSGPTAEAQKGLTVAAKQVSQMGFSVEDIEVNRVNDKVWYPGRPTPEEVTVTFDNLYLKNVSENLWNWFRNTYDPETGFMTGLSNPGTNQPTPWKLNRVRVVQLNNTMQAHSVTDLFGVYAKSWKTAEFNYSTSEFHTLEVVLRYDFLRQSNDTA